MTVYITVTPDFDLGEWARNYPGLATDETLAVVTPLLATARQIDATIPGDCHVEIQVHTQPDFETGIPDESDSWCLLRVTQQAPVDVFPEPPALADESPSDDGQGADTPTGDGDQEAAPEAEDGDVPEAVVEAAVAKAKKPAPRSRPGH